MGHLQSLQQGHRVSLLERLRELGMELVHLFGCGSAQHSDDLRQLVDAGTADENRFQKEQFSEDSSDRPVID